MENSNTAWKIIASNIGNCRDIRKINSFAKSAGDYLDFPCTVAQCLLSKFRFAFRLVRLNLSLGQEKPFSQDLQNVEYEGTAENCTGNLGMLLKLGLEGVHQTHH